MYKTFAKRMMNHKRIEHLFRANYSRMFRLAVALLHDEDEARDAASEVFARLLDGRSSLPAGFTSQSDGQLAGWLLVCTRNRCLDLLSRRQVRERVERLLTVDTEPQLSPVELTEARYEAVNRFVETQLTPRTRAVFTLRFHQGLSYKAISEQLNISETAVYKHLFHALKGLRRHFN